METGNLLRGWTLGDGIFLADGLPLGAEIGRWEAFKRAASKPKRRPVLSVFIENVGTLTSSVKHVYLRRAIKDSLHEPGHGAGTVTLEDAGGSLITNGRSVIRRNDKIKIWAGFDNQGFRHGDLVPRFSGVVKDPVINTSTGEIRLDVQDYGYLMKRALTSGDFSGFNTPKLMVNELLDRLNLADAVFENETGLPTTYILGNTQLRRRNYWKIANGALLGIGYVFYFDANGDLQCKRRDNSSETLISFRDEDIKAIVHKRTAELINSKSFELGNADPVPWSGTVDDSLRWGQGLYAKQHKQSQALYGESADFEDEEMIEGWDNIFPFCRDSVMWFKFPRQVYEMRCAARPFFELLDKVRIDSDIRNIHSQMTIICLVENISAQNYSQTLQLLTHRELF